MYSWIYLLQSRVQATIVLSWIIKDINIYIYDYKFNFFHDTKLIIKPTTYPIQAHAWSSSQCALQHR